MSNRELQNLLIYCGIAVVQMLVVAIAAALIAGTLPGFEDGAIMAPAAPLLGALLAVLTPILTTWLASNRPRMGSADLAHDVDEARKAGTSRKGLTVRKKSEPVTDPATADLLAAQIVAKIRQEMGGIPVEEPRVRVIDGGRG